MHITKNMMICLCLNMLNSSNISWKFQGVRQGPLMAGHVEEDGGRFSSWLVFAGPLQWLVKQFWTKKRVLLPCG